MEVLSPDTSGSEDPNFHPIKRFFLSSFLPKCLLGSSCYESTAAAKYLMRALLAKALVLLMLLLHRRYLLLVRHLFKLVITEVCKRFIRTHSAGWPIDPMAQMSHLSHGISQSNSREQHVPTVVVSL